MHRSLTSWSLTSHVNPLDDERIWSGVCQRDMLEDDQGCAFWIWSSFRNWDAVNPTGCPRVIGANTHTHIRSWVTILKLLSALGYVFPGTRSLSLNVLCIFHSVLKIQHCLKTNVSCTDFVCVHLDTTRSLTDWWGNWKLPECVRLCWCVPDFSYCTHRNMCPNNLPSPTSPTSTLTSHHTHLLHSTSPYIF